MISYQYYNEIMKETKKVLLRLPESLHERVKRQGERERRSVNQELIELIIRGLESQETQQLKLL